MSPDDGRSVTGVAAMHAKAMISDHEFKLGLRQVASPVAIVTSRMGEVRNGLTATAVCSVSAEPPTMLACVNRNASAEAIIAESGKFAINFLTEDQHPIAPQFESKIQSATGEQFLTSGTPKTEHLPA